MKGVIGYLTGEYPRATDTFVQREVAALRARGERVITFSVRRPADEHGVGPEQREERENTFYIIPVSPSGIVKAHVGQLCVGPERYFRALLLAIRTRSAGWRSLVYQLFYFVEAVVLARELRRQKVVHLHNHFANSSCSVGMLAAMLGGVEFSFTIHGPQIFFEPRRWAIREKVKRSRFVVCISGYCRSQVMVFVDPEDYQKLRIVHCGVDPDLYLERREEAERHAGVGDRAKRMLFVGRLAPVKGIQVLLGVMPMLRARHRGVELDIVGDGPMRSELERMARELGVSDAVRFHGYQSQQAVREFLGRADVFVLPSFAEGLPVVLMEALAAEVAAVSTHIAGIPELIEDGLTGLLVVPGSEQRLLGALDRLLADEALRRRMGRAGREKVMCEFNVHAEAARLAKLFAGEREMCRAGIAGVGGPDLHMLGGLRNGVERGERDDVVGAAEG